jgi:hypothetical protein
MTDDTTIAVFNKGNNIILTNLFMSQFMILIVSTRKPMVAAKILKNTAIDVPNMPKRKVRGYMKIDNTRSRTICHIVSILGFPVA